MGAFVYDRGELVGGLIISFKYLFVEGERMLVGDLGNVLVRPRYRAFSPSSSRPRWGSAAPSALSTLFLAGGLGLSWVQPAVPTLPANRQKVITPNKAGANPENITMAPGGALIRASS